MQHRAPPPRTRQILYLHILDTLQLVWGTAVQFCSQKIVFVHVFGAFLAVVIAVGYLSFYASQYMRHLFKVGWLLLFFYCQLLLLLCYGWTGTLMNVSCLWSRQRDDRELDYLPRESTALRCFAKFSFPNLRKRFAFSLIWRSHLCTRSFLQFWFLIPGSERI